MNVFMLAAISEAEKAFNIGEIPVGAVVVYEGKIIAAAHNLKETRQSPILHAEILAINKAAELLKSWRLDKCDLYVTLEPCPMCAGAIAESRIRRLYFGAFDKRLGAAGSFINLLEGKCEIYAGINELKCAAILKDFFSNKR